MIRSAAITLLLLASAYAHGQTMSAAETVNNYSIAQKRLLVISTAQFTNLISQNNFDKDSIMIMACRLTGLPFLLPYNEGFADKVSGGADFINTGKIPQAVQLLNKEAGEKKIQLLVELGIWYLHRPGIYKKDLDSAAYYINAASILASSGNFNNWQNECNFLAGELYVQQGRIELGKKVFMKIASSYPNGKNAEIIAHAYQQLGRLLPNADSIKLVYYQKSFKLYRELQFKEKEIELLWDISLCHSRSNLQSMEIDLREALSLQQLVGFKHTLFTQNLLSFALMNQGKYLDGLEYINAGMANTKWSGIYSIEGNFFMHIGGIYWAIGKNAEALIWFKKGLDTKNKENHLFWYKNLFYATTLLADLGRAEESLAMIDTITGEFPPTNIYERLQLMSIKGYCYQALRKNKFADKNYMALLKLAKKHPSEDNYGELSDTYYEIANFYLLVKNVRKARLFRKIAMENTGMSLHLITTGYSLSYKLDSSEGNFKSALKNHIRYKNYYDSTIGMDQRKKMDELTIKYDAEKKDQDIILLKQQGIVQQTELKQNRLTRNIMIAGTGLLLIIVGLLFSQFKLKQRTNAAMRKKNMALQHLVEEKQWLLKEVHHRVKNNLHTVISLLESQAAYLENDALKAIENSQHRIYAMSLIHQKLYQTEDVKTIDMAVYLPEFIRYLDESFDTHYLIQFKLDIEAINLGVSQAIPIALIINEAVTNSIKYAFPQNKKGTIEITMHKNLDQILLMIADNGIGIDESLFNATSESLGLKLIKGLSADINALIDIKSENGTKITIIFNVDPFNNNANSAEKNKKEIYA